MYVISCGKSGGLQTGARMNTQHMDQYQVANLLL